MASLNRGGLKEGAYLAAQQQYKGSYTLLLLARVGCENSNTYNAELLESEDASHDSMRLFACINFMERSKRC